MSEGIDSRLASLKVQIQARRLEKNKNENSIQASGRPNTQADFTPARNTAPRCMGPPPGAPTSPKRNRVVSSLRSTQNGQVGYQNSSVSASKVGSRIVPAEYGPCIHPADYKAGMIIWGEQVEVDFDQNHNIRDKNRSITEGGTRVYSKDRKLIVLNPGNTHATVAQVLTHNGRGARGKANQDDYISIRELDFQHAAAPAETRHGILWADALPELKNGKEWNRMTNNTVVDISNPREHKTSFPSILMGHLHPESLVTLKRLVAAKLLGSDIPVECLSPPISPPGSGRNNNE